MSRRPGIAAATVAAAELTEQACPRCARVLRRLPSGSLVCPDQVHCLYTDSERGNHAAEPAH